METIIIAAVAKNGVIGKDGKLPWHIPEDFQHFKRTTNGHAIIMGRKTFESIGKPLPNRVNIVLSGSMTQPEDASYFVARTLEQALQLCEKDGFGKAFIIGGTRLFKESLDKDMATQIILTEIKQEYDGDTFFPKWTRDGWVEKHRKGRNEYDFVTYTKE